MVDDRCPRCGYIPRKKTERVTDTLSLFRFECEGCGSASKAFEFHHNDLIDAQMTAMMAMIDWSLEEDRKSMIKEAANHADPQVSRAKD